MDSSLCTRDVISLKVAETSFSSSSVLKNAGTLLAQGPVSKSVRLSEDIIERQGFPSHIKV